MEPPPDFYSASTSVNQSQHRRHVANQPPTPQQPAFNQWGQDDWSQPSATDWDTSSQRSATATPMNNFNIQPPAPAFGGGQANVARQSPLPPAFNNQPPPGLTKPKQQHSQPAYDPYAKMDHSSGPVGGYNQQGYGGYPDGNMAGGQFGQFGMQFGQQIMSDPMLGAAASYGEQFASQQKEKLSRYIAADRLKFYFAVDNAYVGKKIGLLLFPFIHKDWSIKYTDEEEPVPPRMDVNSPDLYIPLMAVLTYITVAGALLGTQGRFTPEQLGLLSSNALAWLICENLLILITKYVMAISQSLSIWHALAFSSYKFVGMIASLGAYLIAGKTFYYACLLYCALALAFFLIRTVKSFVLNSSGYQPDGGTKRKLYLIAYIALSQPFVMWWLTSYVTSYLPPVFKMGPKGSLVPDFEKMDDDQLEKLMAEAPVV